MDFYIPPYSVLVKVDESNRITEVNSDAFITDTSGWTKIDEGYGDKYHHAQGNYFDKLIQDERGIPRYKLEDGVAMERTQEEMDADYTPPTPVPITSERIDEIELALNALMEGVDNV